MQHAGVGSGRPLSVPQLRRRRGASARRGACSPIAIRTAVSPTPGDQLSARKRGPLAPEVASQNCCK